MSAFTHPFGVGNMVKATMDIRVKSVVLYQEGIRTAREICSLYNISERTLRRWNTAYQKYGVDGLKPKSTRPKKCKRATPKLLKERILRLKQKYPSWGARRLKHQFDLLVSWRTVHRIIKKNDLLVRIKAKPQPCKRFQRKHVDSMWQGDTFEFRIHGVGKVYITGFTDDCSRFRIRSKAYLRKRKEEAANALQWALRAGRKPGQIYLDNGKQFIAKDFKAEAKKNGIKLIFGKPYNPRGRGKIEKYHGVLYQELICRKQFKSLSHFRRELWKFDQKYNHWRKQEALGWQTPASIYHNKKYFNKKHSKLKKRTNVLSTK
jgi:transposase InsO family protein